MKTWFWSVLTTLSIVAGCAPGYYERGPAYREEPPAYWETKKLYRNPETEEEQNLRIWSEEMRH